MQGVIAKKMEDKGFGFIKGENGKEYFFHMSCLKNIQFAQLKVGQDVSFEDAEGQKGPRAEDIYV